MDSYPDIFVTATCCQLATDPGIFPSLTSISSSWEPEWDIFFIMLERRNLHSRSKVASIREIVLPSRAAEVFYRPIHDILCGKFPERPSNHSLSLAGNIEILSDESITGCIFCLQSFIPCDEDAKESEQYSHIELPKDDFIPYPSSEEEILSTWRTRNEIWTRKWYPAIRRRRPLSCGRLDPTHTIIRQENCLGVWRIVSPYSSF
ncbi:hypothetical protein CPB86DRAFT_693784 [Serendipita vermifera]|nr:hypothetical protein CPB86DRAFT_693784 [Serendipita vermifera]